MPAISMKKVLVLSSHPKVCQAATAALARDYSVYASPCRRPDVGKFVVNFGPDVIICDRALLKSVSAAARLIPNSAGGGLGLSARPVPGAGSTTITLPETALRPKVVTLLAEGEEHRILECFETGADDYVLTPILADELRAKIDALTEREPADSGATEIRKGAPPSEPEKPAPAALSPSITSTLPAGAPSILGRYELLGIVGQGGYGVVYKAKDHVENRIVALKMLPREATEQPESVARFFRESSALARLNHPNVVRFFEFDSFQGRYFFTMELVHGIDMKDLVDQEAPFDVRRAARTIVQVARGLGALDSINFVHRDVKPENLILCDDGTIKLIDFGLVKILDAATITCENDVLGTPYYMGPEYIAGGTTLDVRYDIYSLGVTFYVFLTGEYPFVGRNTAHVLEKHLREPAPHVRLANPAVPEALDRLIMKMLAKKPEHRPQSPAELVAELEAIFGPSILS